MSVPGKIFLPMMTSLITKPINCVKLISQVSLALTSIVISMPVQALELNFNYSFTGETPEEEILFQEAIVVIEEAASIWESQLIDPVSVNIDINFGTLPEGFLGGARPNMVKVQYTDLLERLFLDQTSSDDTTAFNNLFWNKLDFNNNSFALAMNKTIENPYGAGSKKLYLDNNGNSNNQEIWITTANAKALGLVEENNTQLDGEIRFSDDFYLWNFTTEGDYDLLSAAIHEIGHALGFFSGTDMQKWLVTEDDSPIVEESDLDLVSMMDLFRYSQESAAMNITQETVFGNRTIKGVNDWTMGRLDGEGNPIDYYFSLDGGTTKIASFANGIKYQPSHWNDKNYASSIMNPTIAPDELLQITDLDLQLFDAIGWDLADTVNSSVADGLNFLAQLILGFTGWNLLDYGQQYAVNQASIENIIEQFLSRGRGATSSSGGRFWLSEDNLEGFVYASAFPSQRLSRGSGASSSSGGDYWRLGVENASYLGLLQDSFINTIHTDPNINSAQVPEPNLIFSLLGFSMFGFGSFLKKNLKKSVAE